MVEIGLALDPEARSETLARLIAAKRAGAPILGSDAYLQTLYDFTSYACYPTLVPRIMADGGLVYPCRPIERKGGGNGGHNGLKDIQARLGTPDFWRLRLGIGHPRTLSLAQEVVDFVLHAPRKDELPDIEHALARCLLAWPKLAAGDFAGAQQQLHGKAV